MYQVEKDTKEWGEKVAAGTRERLDAALERGKAALKGSDVAEINEARDELMQAFSAAGQEVYQAQTAEADHSAEGDEAADGDGAAPDPEATADEEDVVEADYEIVDEEKK